MLELPDHVDARPRTGGDVSSLRACAQVLLGSTRDVHSATQDTDALPADAGKAAAEVASALGHLHQAVGVLSRLAVDSPNSSAELNSYLQALTTCVHDASHYGDLVSRHLPPTPSGLAVSSQRCGLDD